VVVTAKTVTLYQLSDPETGRIRYIGQTVRTLRERLYGHISCGRSTSHRSQTHVACWVRSLERKGLEPVIAEIVRVPVANADRVEQILIAFYKGLGHPLTNHHEGGQGTRIVDRASIAKAAAAKRGKKRGPHSAATIAKMSLAKQGTTHSEETRRKLSVAHKGRSLPLAQRQKMSEAHRGRSPSPETCAKLAEAQRRRAQRDSRPITVDGVSHYAAEWAAITGLNYRTISYRLALGWSDHAVITTPLRRGSKR
jgi:hypothetical protein